MSHSKSKIKKSNHFLDSIILNKETCRVRKKTKRKIQKMLMIRDVNLKKNRNIMKTGNQYWDLIILFEELLSLRISSKERSNNKS